MSVLAPPLEPPSLREVRGGSVGALIRERSSSLGHRPYVEYARDDRRLSFRDLEHAVARWAAGLVRVGVGLGATVALLVNDPIEFSIAFLGTMATGRWVAPLHPSTPEPGLGVALARVQADIVFADRAAPAGLDARWVDLRGAPEAPVCREVWDPAASAPAESESGGAVLASSGTTGAPKVIELHQSQLLHTARCVSAHHGLTPADRGFNPLPLFHVNAEVVGLLASLVAGSCLILDDRFHRTHFWRLMAEREITWINAVPAIISRLAEPDPREPVPSQIRFIRSASAPLSATTLARFESTTGIPVLETYGMTEAASQITANPLTGTRKPGSVGLPVGVELRIVTGEEPPEGAPDEMARAGVGHVEIRGPSVIRAYRGGHHADRIDVDGWLRTGDLGHLDEEGYVYLDARIDDVINRGGEKLFPREIEELVLADPEVAAVAVVGAHDSELGQVPVAFVVLHGVEDHADAGAASVAAARIRDHLASALVRGRGPASLNVVRALPTGPTGKVQRVALRDGDVPVIFHLGCR